MVCRIGYASEYIAGCNISQFGEGCESCVPIFTSSWILPIIVVVVAVIVLGVLVKLYGGKSETPIC